MVVNNGQITEILSRGQKPADHTVVTFDADEHVVLPGLINTHHHFYQPLTRAYPTALNKALFKLDELHISGHHDSLAALLLGGAHQADRVMIEGQWKVVDGTLPDTDLEDLKNRHRLAARLLARSV